MKSCGLWRMAIMRVGCIASMRVGCIERALVALNIFAVFVSSQLKCRVESRRIAVALASSQAHRRWERAEFPGVAKPPVPISSPQPHFRHHLDDDDDLPLPPHHPGTTPQTTANMSDNENGENGDELVTKPFKFVTGELSPRLRVYGIDS
jgi:hypothetical protein